MDTKAPILQYPRVSLTSFPNELLREILDYIFVKSWWWVEASRNHVGDEKNAEDHDPLENWININLRLVCSVESEHFDRHVLDSAFRDPEAIGWLSVNQRRGKPLLVRLMVDKVRALQGRSQGARTDSLPRMIFAVGTAATCLDTDGDHGSGITDCWERQERLWYGLARAAMSYLGSCSFTEYLMWGEEDQGNDNAKGAEQGPQSGYDSGDEVSSSDSDLSIMSDGQYYPFLRSVREGRDTERRNRRKDEDRQWVVDELFGPADDKESAPNFKPGRCLMDEILIAAAASGDATLCSRVLKDDANVNFTSIYFGRAIHAAVSRGHEQSVRLLLEQKDLEVNVSDTFRIQTPLVMAAMQGQESAVNLLLNIREDIELGAEDIYGYTALGWACTKGHEGIVKLLLDREDIKADQPGKDHETPLYKAARYGYEAIVRLLLARGDVNPGHRTPWGETAIFIAASSGRESIVRLLLDQKDVDPVSQMPGGETPLLAAASRREPDHSTFELVRLFLARADVNGAHRDKFGRDAFFLAGRSGSVLMMKMLLDKYKLFDPNLRNFSGRTVLHHLADAYGKDGVLHSAAPISYLLERSDVDINIEDKEGRTPLRCAIKADNQPLVQLISERLDRGQQNPMLSENA